MPQRLSRTQIDKLGERLKVSDPISAEDLEQLQAVRTEHDAAMLAVAARLINELGMEPGTRLKTVGTIVDKLRRESIRLSQMQDIAGVRLVADMRLTEQDSLVGRVVAIFPGSKVVDRRSEPSYGYRAVHIIVELDKRYVEIQVRTELQHLWAQIFEGLADAIGRQIRYGLPPTPEAVRGFENDALEVVSEWRRLGESIRKAEELDIRLGRLKARSGRHRWAAFRLRRQYERTRRELIAMLREGSRGIDVARSRL